MEPGIKETSTKNSKQVYSVLICPFLPGAVAHIPRLGLIPGSNRSRADILAPFYSNCSSLSQKPAAYPTQNPPKLEEGWQCSRLPVIKVPQLRHKIDLGDPIGEDKDVLGN